VSREARRALFTALGVFLALFVVLAALYVGGVFCALNPRCIS